MLSKEAEVFDRDVIICILKIINFINLTPELKSKRVLKYAQNTTSNTFILQMSSAVVIS